MVQVILVVHLVLAIAIVCLVLLQRSEGGALGIGGSGNFGGLVSGRSAGNLLTRVTWGLAAGFMLTSLVLTILAGRPQEGRSIIQGTGQEQPASNQPAAPAGPQVPSGQ
jgi:preprotein translocase subunit SecG